MKKRKHAHLGAMAATLLACGGTILQPYTRTKRVKDPNRPEDKRAMQRAEEKRERRRLRNKRVSKANA